MSMFSKAAFRSWPLEIKLTISIWVGCLIYSIALGVWAASMGVAGLSDVMLIPFGIWWVFNMFVLLQFWCYRALGIGFLETWARMVVEPDFRATARNRLSEALAGKRRRR
ncbi:MAG: hypothetical protein E5V18_08310 [Mesorhizobium sp.]|nr:MAG: hypothetical protein E5V18_08310 [Mesorhizobium sp.]